MNVDDFSDFLYRGANRAIGDARAMRWLTASRPDKLADAAEVFISEWIELCWRHEKLVVLNFKYRGENDEDARIEVHGPGWQCLIGSLYAYCNDTANSFWRTLGYILRRPEVGKVSWEPPLRYFIREWARLCHESADDRSIRVEDHRRTPQHYGYPIVYDETTGHSVTLRSSHLIYNMLPRAMRDAARDLFGRSSAS